MTDVADSIAVVPAADGPVAVDASAKIAGLENTVAVQQATVADLYRNDAAMRAEVIQSGQDRDEALREASSLRKQLADVAKGITVEAAIAIVAAEREKLGAAQAFAERLDAGQAPPVGPALEHPAARALQAAIDARDPRTINDDDIRAGAKLKATLALEASKLG